jgi:probable phosphoglycerate mutase
MTSLFLIRHAESMHHVQGLIGGWADFALSPLGRRQAECLAARLRGELDATRARATAEAGSEDRALKARATESEIAIACSDLRRAVQTAEAIGQALGVAPLPTPALREVTSGIADGMTQTEAERHTVPPTEPLSEWSAYPGAEPWRQVYDRVVPYIEGLLGEGRAPRAAIVVTHKIPVHLALCWWLGLGLDHTPAVWFDVQPASLTELRVEPWGGHTVARVNDTAHLYAAGLVTRGT